MKTNSKFITLLAILAIFGLLIPSFSFARQGQGKANGITQRENRQKSIEAKGKVFCSQIEKWVDRIDRTLIERQARIQERQTERLEKFNERRENRDIKLEEHREKWEEKWDEHFSMLEEKASTSEQRQALVDFQETVKEAMASRQAAVDGAISQFREDLNELIANRKTATEQAKNTYLNAYKVAVENAKQACTGGGDPVQIRETLQAALKAAKDKFNSDRKAIEKMDVKKLVEVRQEAFKEALDYFKRIMNEARDELKAVFGESEDED